MGRDERKQIKCDKMNPALKMEHIRKQKPFSLLDETLKILGNITQNKPRAIDTLIKEHVSNIRSGFIIFVRTECC